MVLIADTADAIAGPIFIAAKNARINVVARITGAGSSLNAVKSPSIRAFQASYSCDAKPIQSMAFSISAIV